MRQSRPLWQRSESEAFTHPPFAPPFLKDGDVVIGQTAAILLYLGDRHALAPSDPVQRLWVHQIQLTIADLVGEAHDVHHPLGGGLYYEDQKTEALRRAKLFREERIPKFLGWFEQILNRNPQGDTHLAGNTVSYADLSLFQIVEGLSYAFPRLYESITERISSCNGIAQSDRAPSPHPCLFEEPSPRPFQRTRDIPALSRARYIGFWFGPTRGNIEVTKLKLVFLSWACSGAAPLATKHRLDREPQGTNRPRIRLTLNHPFWHNDVRVDDCRYPWYLRQNSGPNSSAAAATKTPKGRAIRVINSSSIATSTLLASAPL